MCIFRCSNKKIFDFSTDHNVYNPLNTRSPTHLSLKSKFKIRSQGTVQLSFLQSRGSIGIVSYRKILKIAVYLTKRVYPYEQVSFGSSCVGNRVPLSRLPVVRWQLPCWTEDIRKRDCAPRPLKCIINIFQSYMKFSFKRIFYEKAKKVKLNLLKSILGHGPPAVNWLS